MTFKGWGVVGTDLAVRDSSIILILKLDAVERKRSVPWKTGTTKKGRVE
jgi:hypothetical protein